MSPSYQHKTDDSSLEAGYPYPPSGSPYDATTITTHGKSSMSTAATATAATTSKFEDDRSPTNRTPSPTPSELEALKSGVLNWRALTNWRFWLRRDWILYYVIFFVILIVSILLFTFHTQIVHLLTPVATWFHKFRFGWLVPIAVLFVISFPPLFGHEIVAVLCGLVWGLWIGFAIVCAGTFLGEVGNFYAFKYCCRARGEKLEKTKISYACLARVVREGGFTVALVARLSAIPGHFTTAVFATCGMGIVTFSIAAVLSLPKQFVTVYLGVLLESSSGQRTTKSRLASDGVVGVTVLVTFAAMWWIFHKMNKVKPAVIYDRRKARQAKLARAGYAPYSNPDAMNSTFSVGFNPRVSDSDIPLTSDTRYTPVHQRWDKDGRAVGYAGDPLLYAPQPKRAGGVRMVEGGGHVERDDYSPGPRYDRAPVRQASDDSWEVEREYENPRKAPVAGLSSRYPQPTTNPPTLTVSSPPRTMQPLQQQPQPLADLATMSFDPLPEPSFEKAGGKVVLSNPFYAHGTEASDDSFVTAVGGPHSRPGTDVGSELR